MSLLAIVAASLLGSLHCVGMCGGFVATVAGTGRPGDRRPSAPVGLTKTIRALLAYQGARGLAYALLGALAGLLGSGLEQAGALVGMQRVAGPLMGLVLIGMAVLALRPRAPEPLIALGAGPRKLGALDRLRLYFARSLRERGVWAGAAAGLLTALLPCGWLWAYVLVAAGTGSPSHGATLMAVFWLGSLPALFGVGLLAGEVGRRLGRHAPRITAGLLLALGLLSLAGKLGPTPLEREPANERGEPQPTEHAPESTPTSPPSQAPCH